MANTKISALVAGAPAQETDLIPIARSGANFSLPLSGLFVGVGTAIILADNLAGADWGAKVQAADTQLGATAGQIWITLAAGTSAPAASITLAENHVLVFLQGGTWQLGTQNLQLNSGAALIGTGRDTVVLNYAGTGSAIQSATNTVIITNVRVQGLSVLATASTGVAIDFTNMGQSAVSNVRISGFNGAGGIGFLLRGQNVPGAYFNRVSDVMINLCTTAVLINYDTAANIPTSYTFEDVDINVAAVGYDVSGESGWIDNGYIETISGTGMIFRSGALNHFVSGVNLDNSASAGVGTGISLLSGASDNRLAVNIGSFQTSQSDAGGNNSWVGTNTAVFKTDYNGDITGASLTVSGQVLGATNLPVVAATLELPAQTASIGTTTFFEAPADHVYLLIMTVVGQVANTGTANTVSGTFAYTSPYSGTAIASASSSSATLNFNVNSNGQLFTFAHVKSGTNVTYATTLVQNGSTTGEYELDLVALQLI